MGYWVVSFPEPGMWVVSFFLDFGWSMPGMWAVLVLVFVVIFGGFCIGLMPIFPSFLGQVLSVFHLFWWPLVSSLRN